MSDDEFRKLIEAEEQKRDRNWDPAERWRVLQETITWAEGQATVRRNTPARCLELQRAKLARLD
jgi:hypothetical protein